MSGHELDRLSTADMVAAIRSYPRRYREAIDAAARRLDCSSSEAVGRIGSDGATGTEHVMDTVGTLTLVERALSQVLLAEDPGLHPGVLDASQRHWDQPPGLAADTLFDMLDDQCADMAAAIDAVAQPDWSRRGHIADGAPLTALDLAREAVRVGADNLRRLEATLASLARD